MTAATLAYTYGYNTSNGLLNFLLNVLSYAIGVIPLILVFRKAGRQWWEAVVPIYNGYVLLKLVGRPGWWLVLYLIPIVNVVIHVIVMYDLSRSFGHGGWFAVGLVFLSWIFQLILGLNEDRYRGPAAPGPRAATGVA